MPVNPTLFKRVMGSFATGICVVTTRNGEDFTGLTVNTLTSVSLDPQIVLISITRESIPSRALSTAGRFAVSILSVEQEAISNIFATAPMDERFSKVELELTESGLPIVKDCMAHLEANIIDTVDAGDHTLFLAEVTDMNMYHEEANPLLYFQGKYGSLNKTERSISS